MLFFGVVVSRYCFACTDLVVDQGTSPASERYPVHRQFGRKFDDVLNPILNPSWKGKYRVTA